MVAKTRTRVTNSHRVAFRVETSGNRIVGTRDFSADPHPYRIPHNLPAAVHHKTRVAHPSIHRGWLDPGIDTTDAQDNPNILTRDLVTSRIGQGSSAHTTLVEITRLTE